jgi:hypothetical protein
MSECQHEHKVCETHKRTLLKGVTAKVLEVSFDLIVFDSILSQIAPNVGIIQNTLNSLGIAVLIEGFCFGLGYLNERLWNRLQWGRKVVDVAANRTVV